MQLCTMVAMAREALAELRRIRELLEQLNREAKR